MEKRVTDVEHVHVAVHDGPALPSRCSIWAAGVLGNVPKGFEEESLENGRLKVNDYHEILGTKSIYAIGDVAIQYVKGWDHGWPMLAPVAIQQAQHLGKNLKRRLAGKERTTFRYFDKGSMATVGRNHAVLDAKGLSFGGFLGWFVWMFIHLISIMGFRRKLMVFMGWVWNYISYNRGNRLIIVPGKAETSKVQEELAPKARA